MATIIGLWPFVVAYMRKRITLEQLRIACERFFYWKELAYRVTFSIVLGPIYGWYVLAATAMNLTRNRRPSQMRYLVFNSLGNSKEMNGFMIKNKNNNGLNKIENM